MTADDVPPNLFVVFGGTGDLMERKLLPALCNLSKRGELGERCVVLGVARSRAYDDASYRAWACGVVEASGVAAASAAGAWARDNLHYFSLGDGEARDHARLAAHVRRLEAEAALPGNRTLYMALPPAALPATIAGIGATGLAAGPGWTRLVIEKPFGQDLTSARDLNAQIHAHFGEDQVYRIDHYLGKETVQNLLVLRFANMVFESLWNRDRVESVQITVAETLGLEGRARYFDAAGAVRDMVQSHLTQLLTLVAMEVPVAFDADAIRSEKVKVLRAIAPVRPADVVLGQYTAGTLDGRNVVPAYVDEAGVAKGSSAETFAALRLEIDNWRWKDVPFYLRTGKRMPRRVTQIVVQFRRAPVSLFGTLDGGDSGMEIHRNILFITLQPDEGFDLRFEVKRPGEPFTLETHDLDFCYGDVYGPLGNSYETLLRDILVGDQTLFVRADEVEASWQVYTPILGGVRAVSPYPSGTWGPPDADRLVARDAGRWITGGAGGSARRA